MNKEDIQNTISQHKHWEFLEHVADQMGRDMHLIQNEFIRKYNPSSSRYTKSLDFLRITTTDSLITASFEEYVCGCTDYIDYTFPIDWLFDSDWKSKYMKQLEDERVINIEKARIEKEKKDKENEESAKKRRFEMYINLKKEFEIT